MKKWLLRILGIVLVLIAVTYGYLELQWQPRIYKVTGPVELGEGMRMNYDFISHDPFRDDVMWIKPYNPDKPIMKQYLFDLKEKKVTHVLENAEAVLVNKKHDCTLGTSFGSLPLFLRWKVQKWMNLREEHQDELYFALDIFDHENMGKNYLQTVDSIIENTYLSPDGRYAKINVLQKSQYILDFEERTLVTLPNSVQSWEGGWLSDQECFYRDLTWNVCVYDVNKQVSMVIVTQPQLAKFLAKHDLQINPQVLFTVRSVPTKDGDRMIINGNSHINWNKNHLTLNEDEAWVVEIDRESRELKLLHKRFPHRWSGKWNSDLTKYVYRGDNKTYAGDAVYLYDVEQEELKVLEAGGRDRSKFSMPNFYGDQIIYVKDNALWIMNDDGTGKQQLFPAMN